jgi:integrase
LLKQKIDRIQTDDVLKVLNPRWREKNVTAHRLRSRLEELLDAAKVAKLRSGENPALWRGHLEHHFRVKVTNRTKHFAAMPYEEVPAFFAVARDILKFLILTACRSGEVRQAQWSEFDLDNAVWTIPAERMKMQRPHRVPLSSAALEVLSRQKRSGPFVFKRGRLAATTLTRNIPGEYTAHGFRSSFRDWCSEATDTSSEVAEMALAHAVKNQVEAAYRRGDLLEKRRVLMEQWSNYVTNQS